MEDLFIKILMRKYPDLVYSFNNNQDSIFIYNNYDKTIFTNYCLGLSMCMRPDIKVNRVTLIGNGDVSLIGV